MQELAIHGIGISRSWWWLAYSSCDFSLLLKKL